jgi:hypothetical protein
MPQARHALTTSHYDLGVVTRYRRVSKKIRKYTKGKLRYKASLVLVRPRQTTGLVLRLTRLAALSTFAGTNCGFRPNVNKRLLLDQVNMSMGLRPTFCLIQDKMLTKYLSGLKKL